MKVKQVLIGLLGAFLVVLGMNAVSNAQPAIVSANITQAETNADSILGIGDLVVVQVVRTLVAPDTLFVDLIKGATTTSDTIVGVSSKKVPSSRTAGSWLGLVGDSLNVADKTINWRYIVRAGDQADSIRVKLSNANGSTADSRKTLALTSLAKVKELDAIRPLSSALVQKVSVDTTKSGRYVGIGDTLVVRVKLSNTALNNVSLWSPTYGEPLKQLSIFITDTTSTGVAATPDSGKGSAGVRFDIAAAEIGNSTYPLSVDTVTAKLIMPESSKIGNSKAITAFAYLVDRADNLTGRTASETTPTGAAAAPLSNGYAIGDLVRAAFSVSAGAGALFTDDQTLGAASGENPLIIGDSSAPTTAAEAGTYTISLKDAATGTISKVTTWTGASVKIATDSTITGGTKFDNKLVNGHTYDLTLSGKDVAGNDAVAKPVAGLRFDNSNPGFDRILPDSVATSDTLNFTTAKPILRLKESLSLLAVVFQRNGQLGSPSKGDTLLGLSGSKVRVLAAGDTSKLDDYFGTALAVGNIAAITIADVAVLTNTTSDQQFTVIPDAANVDSTKYLVTVFARDLAGNLSSTVKGTFNYKRSFAVPQVTHFKVEITGSTSSGPDGTPAAADSVLVGEPITVRITAMDSVLSRVAVGYKGAAVKVTAVGGKRVKITGSSGLVDNKNGSATLAIADWIGGVQSVTIADSGETVSQITVLDSDQNKAQKGATWLTWFSERFLNYSVTAPTSVTTDSTFSVVVVPVDKFGNPTLRKNVVTGGDTVYSELDVTFSTNTPGVTLPAGLQRITAKTGKIFAVTAPATPAAAVTISLNNAGDTPLKGSAFGTQPLGSVTVQITAKTVVLAAPDTLWAVDWKGSDGSGDNGGFLLFSFNNSSTHASVGNYRLYRQVKLTTGAASSTWVPWAKVDAFKSPTSLGSAGKTYALVATLDNVASLWAVSAESGSNTVSGATQVTAPAAAKRINGTNIVIAELLPRSDIAAKKLDSGSPMMAVTPGAVRSIDDLAPVAVASINAAYNAITSKIKVDWTSSLDDRVVTPASSFGNPDIMGVNHYIVALRSGEEVARVSAIGRPGSVMTAEVSAPLGELRDYTVIAADLENQTASNIFKSAVAAFVDAQGNVLPKVTMRSPKVDMFDFFAFAADFGKATAFNPLFDINKNNVVDFPDFLGFSSAFGKTAANFPAAKPVVPEVAGVNANAKMDLGLLSEAVKLGSEVTFDVSVDQTVDLRGYGFIVSYDQEKFEFVRAEMAQSVLTKNGGETPLFLARNTEPGRVTVANFISNGLTVSGAGSAANLVFRVKSDFYGETQLGLDEISVIDGAQHLNALRSVAPLSLMITPDRTELVQNYPNPFNPETTIRYSLAKPANVTLTVYNMLGQQIRTLVNAQQRTGRYIVSWNGKDDSHRSVAAGMYFYRISAGDYQSVKRMMMVK